MKGGGNIVSTRGEKGWEQNRVFQTWQGCSEQLGSPDQEWQLISNSYMKMQSQSTWDVLAHVYIMPCLNEVRCFSILRHLLVLFGQDPFFQPSETPSKFLLLPVTLLCNNVSYFKLRTTEHSWYPLVTCSPSLAPLDYPQPLLTTLLLPVSLK